MIVRNDCNEVETPGKCYRSVNFVLVISCYPLILYAIKYDILYIIHGMLAVFYLA